MKIKKLICVGIISIFLMGLFGCGNQSSKLDKREQTNSNQAQSSKNGQPDEPPQNNTDQSTEGDVNSNSPVQNNDSTQNEGVGQAESSSMVPSTPPQTQQEALNKIKAVLKTRVPLILPTNVPVEKGHYLTAAATSETWYYKVNFYETDQPADIGSQKASKGNLIATVEGTEYKNAASAKEAINGYVQADTSQSGAPIIDLGHNIKAIGDAGLGHGYLIWNEGRWCINLDSPNDPAYKNKKYPDSKQLAKNIVEYLNNHMLPAPQKIGVISINNWNNSQGTTIEWQYNEMVYKVWSQDPMTALKVAVAK
jgi:hypothetical protein